VRRVRGDRDDHPLGTYLVHRISSRTLAVRTAGAGAERSGGRIRFAHYERRRAAQDLVFSRQRSQGSPQAKQTTPVVFLHDHKGSRAVFASLVQKLQANSKGEGERPSFAAVTVDLRAHGESTKLRINTQVELNAAKLNKEDFIAMASNDLDAVRGFLLRKNDEGELNLEKLCLVGSGMAQA